MLTSGKRMAIRDEMITRYLVFDEFIAPLGKLKHSNFTCDKEAVSTTDL